MYIFELKEILDVLELFFASGKRVILGDMTFYETEHGRHVPIVLHVKEIWRFDESWRYFILDSKQGDPLLVGVN